MARVRHRLGLGLCWAVMLVLLHGSATAQREQDRLANFDTRTNLPPQTLGAIALQQNAASQLQSRDSSIRIDFDEILATPTFVYSREGFLTGSNGVGNTVGAGTAQAVSVDDFNGPLKNFLNQYSALFGFGAKGVSGVRTNRDFVSVGSGMRTVVWQQQVDGIPVFEGMLIAHTTRNGELVNVSSHFLPEVVQAAEAGTANHLAVEAAPPVSAQEAVTLAAQNVGETDTVAAVSAVGPAPEGAEQRQQFRAPSLLGDTDAQLVWLPMDRTQMRLCWAILLTGRATGEMFHILIDAQTGEAVVRQGLTEYLSNASYRVYNSDSPSPYSPACPTPCTTQPALVARQLVTISALSSNDSPNGWINDGDNTTMGNNVDAHLDKNGDNVPDPGSRPTGSPFRVFDCPMDLSQQPVTYTNAAVVQLFYWCNWMHDKLYELGFTEAAGNFQNNNFGRGGYGNDAVQADAQDGSGYNNANFSTPPDGSPGRMQMYIFNYPSPNRDGDFDADVVLHEYTHGLSNRRVGGGVGISALQSGGMGEGWSDFYALSLLSEPADDVNGNYAAGGYVTYQLSGMTQNYYFGIRRYPYSTDMTKNPLTFKDIDPAQASSHTGIPRSPIIGTTANEVHNMGEVWCVTLWEARAKLINKYGWSVGNQLMLQLVTDGMNLSPANPNFLQARDAIIQADQVDTGGANRNELWTAFAKWGMGASATSPSSSTTTGLVEAYDVPDFLKVLPGTGLSSTGPVGGPFSPSVLTNTLSNTGTIALSWAASKTAAWLNLSVTSGMLAAGGSSPVVVSINAAANGLVGGNYSDTVTFSNQVSGMTQTRTVTLAVTPPRLYFFPLDSDPGWPRQGEWAFGKPAGLGGTSHGQHDPTSGATGTNVFGINLNGDYSTAIGGPYFLTVGPLNFKGYAGAKLQFQRWLNTDYPSYVYATIEVSSNGTAWTQIFGNTSGVEIADSAWTRYQYDISAMADNQTNVYVRWGHRVASSGAYAYSGWNIDDIEFLASSTSSLKVQLPSAATEGDGVLVGQGSVTLTPAPANNLTVTLTSSDTSEVTVPATVTVPSGQTNVTFDVTIVDDTVLDGDQSSTITAAAVGYPTANATIVVHDNETATLTVAVPTSATEGDGVLTNAGVVTVSAPVAANVAVALSSSDTTEVTVPSTITIPSGQTSASFNVTIVDDNQIDGTQTATITAHVPNWTDGFASITVFDNENTNLTVTLPASAYEGDGVLTNAGHVSISGIWPSDLVVSLTSINTDKVTVPPTVTIPAGQTSAAFNVIIVDNTIQDGTQIATVTASAPGFVSGSANIAVKDNDVYQFVFSAIASPQSAGTPFTVSIAALDINGSTITVYQSAISLTAAGDGGADSVQPSTVTAWTNGVWTGAVRVNTPDTNVRLTANDGAGQTGLSNPFDVQLGPLDHFGWSFVPSPQHQDIPFPVAITAQDAGNNTVTTFTNVVTLAAQASSPTGTICDTVPSASANGKSFGNVVVGQTYYYQASGCAGINFDNSAYVDPDGHDHTLSDCSGPFTIFSNAPAEFTCPGLVRWSLVGKVGSACIQLGSSGHFIAPASGTIMLYLNDDIYSDNSGSWNVCITPIGGVAVSPTNSGNFIGGVWTGTVTVLEPGTNVVLVASDGVGHYGMSTQFVVQAFSDLGVTMTGTPDPVSVGGNLTYSITVTNGGPDKAVRVVVSDALPSGVTFISATGSQGTGTVAGSTVTFALGTMGSGATATVAMAVHPVVAGLLTNTVTVACSATDSNVTDNSATSTVVVQGIGVLGVSSGSNVCGTVLGSSSTGQSFGSVNAGQTYGYQASGCITLQTGAGAHSATPDGVTYSNNCTMVSGPLQTAGSDYPCPGLLAWSLVAKVGGNCIQMGNNGSFVAPASGSLVLYFSDNGYGDNSGSWNVCLTAPSDLSSSGPAGGPFSPVSLVYTLINSGTAPLDWSSSDGPTWLSLSASNGTLAVGASVNITATINDNANGLAVGVYSNAVAFINLTNGNGTTTRPVIITVLAAPNLAVAPASGLTSVGPQGGPISPTSQSYTLSNTGSVSLNWTGGKSASWVTLSAASGSLTAGGSTTVTVSINANANSLTAGSYSDTVTFTNTTNGAGSTTRLIALTVNGIGILSVTPAAGWTSSGPAGGPFSPASQVYALTNSGLAPLDWSVAGPAAWASVSAAGGTLAAGDGTNVTVSINATANGLAVGVYSNTVTFTNLSTGNGTTTRLVTLTATLPGVLGVISGTNVCGTVLGSLSAGQSFGPVNAGQTYGYQASGCITLQTGVGAHSATPDGVTYSNNCTMVSGPLQTAGSDHPCPGLLAWSLVAKVGGNCIQMGNNGSFVAPASGSLVLYFSDNNYSDNSGSWNVCLGTPTDLAASGPAGGPFSPVSQMYTLTNSGSASLDWAASNTTLWASLSVTNGTLAPGTSTNITVSVNANANGLSAGVYSNSVTFINLTNGNGTTTRIVALTVLAPSNLSVSPTNGLTSAGPQGGPFSPANQSYTLSNTGSVSLNWSASKSANWVTLSSTNGSLIAGSNTTVTVSINTNANSLAVGSYSDTVTFTNTTNGTGSTSRNVALAISVPPSGPSNLVATAVSGSQINLTWTDSSNNEDGFRIERATSASNAWMQIAQVLANTTSYRNTGLWPGTTYYYRVRAYNLGGNSDFSNVASAGTPSPCTTVVAGWGNNNNGQATPPAGLSNVVALAGGNYYSLALRSDRTVVSWGGTTLPVGLTGVVAIAAGQYHSLALKSDASVVGWGDNSYGQAVPPSGLTGIVAVAAGLEHSLALKNDGTVVGWGTNDYGQATPPAGLSGVVAIAAGAYHSLALRSDGTVVGWGFNAYGQATPPAGLTGVVAIAAGFFHNVALKSDGSVICWGDGSYGESTPPAGLIGVVALAAGAQHSLALKSDGTIVGWGGNGYGQLTPPAGLSNVVAIAAGYLHSLAAAWVCPPNTPSGLTATAVSSSQINLAWTDNSNNEDGFKIERAADSGGSPGTWNQIATVSTNVTAYSDMGLSPNTAYWYRVRAYNAGGNSGYSNQANAKTLPPWMQWQWDYFGCTNCPQAATTADPDGDGQNNLMEFLAGTDPTNNLSFWQIQASPTNSLVLLPVNFSENSTGSSITNRLWSFGDGGAGSGTNPSHTYTNPGTYSVGLTIFNLYGTATLVATNLITVSPFAVWTNANASGNWSSATSWSPVGIPDHGNDVIFGTAGSTAMVDNVSRTVGNIAFYRSADFSVGASGGANVTVSNGITVASNVASDFTFTVSAPLVLGGTNTWTTVGNGVLQMIAPVRGAYPITKMGSGTLILSGTNSYSGGTTISNGTLRIAGSGLITNTPIIDIASGAIFDVSGRTNGNMTLVGGQTLKGGGIVEGNLILTGGSTLSPGSSVGTLTFLNDLVVSNAAVLQYDLGTNSDLTVVSSNLTLGGTLNINNAGGFATGVYTLFTYGGVLTYNGLTIGATPNTNLVYTIDTNTAGQVNLNVVPLPTTILADAGDLSDRWGTLASSNSVAVLVVDTGNNGFVDPQPAFPLGLGATWGADDKVVGLWNLTNIAADYGDGQLYDETVVTYAGGVAPGQRLQLYWFPSLTLASNTVGVTYYGKYADTNSPPLDGSDEWTMPAGGSSVHLKFWTARWGGTNPQEAGFATLLTSEKPLASFSASPTNGLAPLAVAFTDTSTGTISNRFWDFGDSSTSNTTATSLSHTYGAGSYTVTLVVSGPGGVGTNSKPGLVTALTPLQHWQMDYFGCADCPQAAGSADPDGDGQSNLAEFLAGTDPTDNASAFRIVGIAQEGNDLCVTWTTVGGRTNTVQATVGDPAMGDGAHFIDISGWIIIPASGGATTNYIDVGGATNGPSRFYRIRLVP